MLRRHRIIAALTAGAVIAVPLAGCGSSSSPSGDASSSDGSKVSVVASISQWGSVAAKIGGDDVSVTSVVTSSSGTTSHEYEPTTQDVANLTGADIAIVNGAGYDSWAVNALADDTDTTVINVADLMNVQDGANPHLWFSVDAIDKTASAVLDALKASDSAHSSDYDTNYAAWTKAYDSLKESLDIVKQETNGRTYVATESVAQYLLDDLGMTDKTPEGFKNATANESEPSAQDIDEMTQIVQNKQVDVLVVNDSETSDIATNLDSAGQNSKISIFHVTESMPSEVSNVLDWINMLAASLMMTIPSSSSASASASASE